MSLIRLPKLHAVFAILVGAFLGLALIKFGNPIILDHLVTQSPQNVPFLDSGFTGNPETLVHSEQAADWSEVLFRPWSMMWGVAILGVLAVMSLVVGSWKRTTPRWVLILPLAWLAWQFLSATQSVNANLTQITLMHFSACLICYYLGWYGLAGNRHGNWLWPGLIIGLLLVFWNGFNQHYGGLEATRRFIYEQSNWRDFSPLLLKRLAKNRIFSTLVYPNALAGVILLLLPACLIALWRTTMRLPHLYQGVSVGLFAYIGLACLVWSGSKAGWLIAILMGFVALLRLPMRRHAKGILLCVVLVAGITGFFIRYSGYFSHGATSVSARFEYWRGALLTFQAHPWFGTGPGTFSIPFSQVKNPESEMAKLVHNDYLEQASDSGILGFIAYFVFISGLLVFLYRKRSIKTDPLRFAIWLGILGWSVQSCVEFGLYIPALAWPAFTFSGWLVGTTEDTIFEFDNAKVPE